MQVRMCLVEVNLDTLIFRHGIGRLLPKEFTSNLVAQGSHEKA
jgi:hypothetical protein